MKKALFMAALTCSILAQNFAYSQFVPLGTDLSSIKITYPLENSVIQYNTSTNSALVAYAGQVLTGTKYSEEFLNNRIYLKIEKYNYGTKQWSHLGWQKINFENCTNCGTPDWSKPKTFYHSTNSLNTLSKGWYRVALVLQDVCYNATSSYYSISPSGMYTQLNNWRNFGVGDVYYIAGQSNASGFTRVYDKTLVMYESTTFQNEFDQFPPIALADSEIPEGSIVSRMTSQNRLKDNAYSVKGLPINPSDNNTGLTKFVSGKPQDNGEMGMAPNGIDSWAWARVGKLLVENNQSPVLLFNAAIAGSSITDWSNLFYNEQLKRLLQTNVGVLGARGVLWQQGETETLFMRGAHPTISAPAYTIDYSNTLQSIINNSKTHIGNSNLNWFIGKTSFATGRNPDLSDTRVIDETVTIYPIASGVSKKYYANPSNTSNLLYEQNSLLNSSNKIYAGPNTDDIGLTHRSTFTGLHIDGYQGTVPNNPNSKNGLQTLAENWNSAIQAAGITSGITSSLPLKTKVDYSNNIYTLKLMDPTNNSSITSGTFRWVYNDDSPFDMPNVKGTSATFNIPSTSIGLYITCYYQPLNTDIAFKVSVPYYVKPNCTGCRVGGTVTHEIRNRTITPSGGSTISDISNFKDGTNFGFWGCIPSWLTVSKDLNTNGYAFAASANNTGSVRSGIVYIKSKDDAGNTIDVQTINITQSTPSTGCTNNNLSNLTESFVSQDWGSLMKNQTVAGGPLKIANVTYSHGLGTHANSVIKYNLSGMGYGTFSGAVGRDDAADPCGCGTQKVQFQIKADGVLLWTSGFHTPTSQAENFSVNITGKNELELVALDAGDQIWGDQADWVNTVLTCGTGCNVSAPSNPTASFNPISNGQTTVLTSSCPVGVINWSTGQSGSNSVSVNPSATTTYSVFCDAGNGCTSSSKQITVTVGTPPNCNNAYLNGTWTYGSAGWNAPPKVDGDIYNNSININGVTYTKGIGTHAYSEIIYDLGASHNYQSFIADVGRDDDAASCNCGAQDEVFKVLNNATGAVLAGPVTKGNYQSATTLTANLSGVRFLKLVVDNGTDGHNWGDYANWANARLVCPNSSRIGAVNSTLLEESESQELTILPNPVSDKFQVQYFSKEENLFEIEIYNATGKLMKRQPQIVNQGQNEFTLSSNGLTPGLYFLRFYNGIVSLSKKIIVE